MASFDLAVYSTHSQTRIKKYIYKQTYSFFSFSYPIMFSYAFFLTITTVSLCLHTAILNAWNEGVLNMQIYIYKNAFYNSLYYLRTRLLH